MDSRKLTVGHALGAPRAMSEREQRIDELYRITMLVGGIVAAFYAGYRLGLMDR